MVFMIGLAGWMVLDAWPGHGRPNGSLRKLPVVAEAPETAHASMEPLGGIDLPASPINLSIMPPVLYAPMGAKGFGTIDISDPGRPRLAAFLEGVKDKTDLHGSSVINVLPDPERRQIYVLDRRKGISLFDVRDPFNPVPLKQLAPHVDLNLNATSITLAGDHLYLACGGGGLHVLPRDFDESTPWPAALAYFDHTRQSSFMPPHWLLVADGYDTGMQVLSLADPAHPRVVHLFQTGTYCDQVVPLEGGYAVMNNRGMGLTVLDMSDPSEPVIANCQLPYGLGELKCMALWRGRYLICGHDRGWIHGFDMNDPVRPVRVLRERMAAEVNTLLIDGDVLYAGLWGENRIVTHRLIPPTTTHR